MASVGSMLSMSREQRSRALLAELGISPDNAAVSKKAVMEALLKVMPSKESEAMTQGELFAKAVVPSKTTGQKALRALLETRQIQRSGQGLSGSHIGTGGNPYRYFLFTPNHDMPERATRSHPPKC